MLSQLTRVLKELPELLTKPDLWQSEHKDQGGPEADRLHMPSKGYRICLHKFYDTPQVAMHSHPWPFASKILRGSYEMVLASGPHANDVMATVRLSRGDTYEVPTQNTWHSVRPLVPCVWTVMVNGPRWSPAAPLIFTPLPSNQVCSILIEFSDLLSEIEQGRTND